MISLYLFGRRPVQLRGKSGEEHAAYHTWKLYKMLNRDLDRSPYLILRPQWDFEHYEETLSGSPSVAPLALPF